MNVLDLFAGACGGWSLGLHRAGFRTVAACEIDPWRRERYARNFPGARLYDDVRTLTAERLRADGVPAIDVVAGSPPCQDASSANPKGRGVDGERTGLFWEALRIVRELRPRWVLLENVPGLRTRGYDRVHDALEAAGYTVRPLVVGAWHAGAPHRRNRVWIVADAAEVGRGSRWARGLDPGSAREREQALHDANAALLLGPALPGSEPNRVDAGAIANAHEARLEIGQGEPGDTGQEQPTAIGASLRAWDSWNGGAPDLGRMDDGLPKGMARHMLAAYGDAVVPIIPELIGRAIMRLGQQWDQDHPRMVRWK